MFENPLFEWKESYRKQFQKEGFVKISQLFNKEAIAFFRSRVEAEIDQSHFGDLVSRMKYELKAEKEVVYQIIQTETFRKALTRITGRDLFFAFDLAVELEKNTSKGFPWHVGTQTFAIQRLEDFGCTLWIPLANISVKGQGGGVACVPKSIISGEFIYEKLEPAIVPTLQKKESQGIKTTIEDYYFLRHEILNAGSILEILETHKVEEDFQVGDALLFDKMVVHRSVPLREGPLEKRAAFALRLMNPDAQFNKKQAINIDYPARKYGADLYSKTHKLIQLEHDEPFINSAYFDYKNQRYIKKVDTDTFQNNSHEDATL